MQTSAEIPCSTCQSWNNEKKTFACDPNKCEKLSRWLMKHVKPAAVQLNEPVQYVV